MYVFVAFFVAIFITCIFVAVVVWRNERMNRQEKAQRQEKTDRQERDA